jgi:hypothetical protein
MKRKGQAGGIEPYPHCWQTKTLVLPAVTIATTNEQESRIFAVHEKCQPWKKNTQTLNTKETRISI